MITTTVSHLRVLLQHDDSDLHQFSRKQRSKDVESVTGFTYLTHAIRVGRSGPFMAMSSSKRRPVGRQGTEELARTGPEGRARPAVVAVVVSAGELEVS